MKKLVLIVLIFTLLIGCLPFVSLSADSNDSAEEYIYYSDLFYGYGSYLRQSKYLVDYSRETQEAFNGVYSDYMDSPMFAFSNIKHALPLATDVLTLDIKEYAKFIGDLTGLTSFTYENALDKANQQFATELMGESILAKKYGAENKWVKNLNKFLKVYDNFTKTYDVYEKTEITIYEETITYFADNSAFSCIEITKIESLKEIVLPNVSKISSILSNGSSALDGAQTLMLGLMIEDIRLCIIDEVLASQQKDTTLYDGMSRLKKQLSNGFVSYFYHNYLEEQVLKEVEDYFKKKLDLEGLINEMFFKDKTGLVSAKLKLLDAITNVACYVVFDVIFDVPDIDDLTTQAVLTQYSNDFFCLIRSKTDVFTTQFSNEDVSTYETLFAAYQAANNAAFKASEKITLSSNKLEFNDIKTEYYKKDIYSNYIDSIKEIIKTIPKENRILVDLGNWEINSNTLITSGSDIIDENKLYTVNNQININLIIKSNIELTLDANAKIKGLKIAKGINIYCNKEELLLETEFLNFDNVATLNINSGNLVVNNNITLTGNDWNNYYNSLYLLGGNLYVKGDLSINANGTVKVDNNSNLIVEKDITLKPGSSSALSYEPAILDVYTGIIHCKGNLNALAGVSGYGGGNSPKGAVYMNNDESIFYIDGDLNIDGNSDSRVDGSFKLNYGEMFVKGDVICNSVHAVEGKKAVLVLNGSEPQSLGAFPIYNLEIDNPLGIVLKSDISIYGSLITNDNPIKQNGYLIRINANSQVYGNNHFNSVFVDSSCTLVSNLCCESLVMNNSAKATLTIPQKIKLTVLGDLEITYMNNVKNYGELEIGGNLFLRKEGGSGWGDTKFYNYNITRVFGNIICGSYSYIYMENEHSVLSVKGDIDLSSDLYCKVTSGTTILSGNEKQSITNYNCPTFVIENDSELGCYFDSLIFPSVLFDHKGNNYTLSKGGTFVDYDGDGIKDNVDPKPTVGNPCVLDFESEDTGRGTVSNDRVETIGGTKITVTAAPTFKYSFAKWIDSAGKTVSTNAEYTFVAKKDETYTAVFTKRQQPITIQTDGGAINVPQEAEIESEVIVTVTENDGYVYTEGSLAYNGVPIENGCFIMPDETVILTAEFVRNENYFALKEILDLAKSYTYQSYSKESFDNLTDAINVAETALVNNITADESQKQIALLQAAMSSLEDKYIVSVTLKTIPSLYINVPDMINDVSILVTYDNGTTLNVSGADCAIEGYDATMLGEQYITVMYGNVVGTVSVTVQKRLLSDCVIYDIFDQIYDGIKNEYSQKPSVLYSSTNEQLTENIDYTVTYLNNTEIGKATIIITGIGDYSGSKSTEFNIYCVHNYEVISRVEPSCTKIGYLTEQCEICKKTNSYENIITDNLPESEHNYGNKIDVSYYYTNEGASSLVLKFSSSTLTESSFDKIYIYDRADTLIGTYSGSSLADKTVMISGDLVRIRLTTDGSVAKYGFSLDYIAVYYDHLLMPTIEHDYGDWITLTEPTPIETGIKHKICGKCGNEVTEEIPTVKNLGFKGASLSLHYSLILNYKVDASLFNETGYSDPFVVFRIGNTETTVREYTIKDGRYVFEFTDIAPTKMTEKIYSTLYATYNGVQYSSATREYSVAQYCYDTLDDYSGDQYAELRTLVVDLLNYGTQSQIYMNYNMDNLANAMLTDTQKQWGTVDNPVLENVLNTKYETVEDPLASWKGAALRLEEAVVMRFKLSADNIDGMTVKIKTKTNEWEIPYTDFIKTDGGYYVYFNGLHAAQMSESVYLTVYKNDAVISNTVRYSIESYAYSNQNSTNENLAALVNAMMNYGKAAYNYVN